MSWLTKIAMKKRWLTFLIVALITGASIWSTLTLQMELIPNIELPVTSVITVYPQAKPEKVMNDVTIYIESAISGMNGLDQLISTAAEGSTFTLAMFEYGTDMDKVNSTIRKNLAKLDLPPEIRELPATMPQLKENPQLYAIDMNMMPVVMVSLTGDMLPSQLEEIAVTEIIPRLETIEGVYHVGVDGGSNKQALVNLDAEEMNAAGVSMSQVAAIIASQEYGSLNKLENATLETDTLKLSDIGEVNLGLPSGTAVSRTNGQTSVMVSVMKEAEANTVTVANAVIDELESIETTLGNDVRLITVMDQSEYIETSIGDLTRNAIIGFLLAVIVVFFFLMAFRASLVTAISIPLSLLVGFLVMRFLGITINLLTLSAVAIVVGRVIDNSIVVLEVIYRRIQQGEAFREAALNGVREVAAPITSSTLATVVIFIPIAFVGGIVGEMFMPFALTMTIALIASLIVALMVIPPLSNFTISRKAEVNEKHTWYQRAYIPVLKWSLKYRAATLIIAVLLFFGSFSLVPIIGTAFMPQMSEKMLTVDIELPRGADLASIERAAMLVEQVIADNPDVTTFQTDAGTSSSLIGSFSSLMGSGSTASIMVTLDREVDLEQQSADMRSNLEGIVEGGTVTVTTGDPMAGAMMGSSLDISIRGDNYEDIASTGRLLFDKLQDVSGLAELDLALSDTEPKLDIVPDPAKMMATGLPAETLQQISQEFMLISMGSTISRVNIEGEIYDVYISGIAQNLNSVETAKGLRVGWPESVALGDIATVTLGEQQSNIQRIDEKLAVSVTGIITAEDVGSVNRAVQKKIDALPLPDRVEVTMGGVMERMQESFSGMFIAIIVAILLAYAVIAVTFRSFLKPIIIMVSLPLASIGALVGLLLAGQPLGVSALMGVLMLVGIVLTNAIVLIDLVEKLRKKGMDTYDALVESGRTRMRPILMTALTTMIAMLPIAVGLGEGTVLSAELAIVVIGGLFSSTLLTLLVIPVLYSLGQGLRQRIGRT